MLIIGFVSGVSYAQQLPIPSYSDPRWTVTHSSEHVETVIDGEQVTIIETLVQRTDVSHAVTTLDSKGIWRHCILKADGKLLLPCFKRPWVPIGDREPSSTFPLPSSGSPSTDIGLRAYVRGVEIDVRH